MKKRITLSVSLLSLLLVTIVMGVASCHIRLFFKINKFGEANIIQRKKERQFI